MDWVQIIVVGFCGGLAALLAQVTTGGPYVVTAGKKERRISYFAMMVLALLLFMGLSEAYLLPRLHVWLGY